MTRPTGRPKGRPPGTGKPKHLTVTVRFKVSPVLAARVLALARPGESLHTAARRLLGVAVEEEPHD